MVDEIELQLIPKLNELYREAELSQIEDNLAAKSNASAQKYMEDGLKHFFEKSFEDARRSYTLCLAYAEDDSELIGQAYANRSAALFKLDYFEQCLLDIDRALNSNYAEDKKKGLHERKEQASKKVEQSQPLASSRTREVEAEWRDKLCDFHNPHIPGASNKIKLKSNEKWGRHLVATENIDAGEILTCQKFFTMMENDDTHSNTTEYHVCSHCLLYHPALIPCPRCTTMYCSEHCRTEAFNSYHRIECRIFQTKEARRESNMQPIDFMALRCLLIGTGQGSGLASLVEKIKPQDIVDVKANIDEFTKKPFSSDYMFLLRLCRKFHTPLSDKVDYIVMRIIFALRKAGYFDSGSDRLQHEASIDPKAEGYTNSKSERDDHCNETDKDITSTLLDSVKPADGSDDKKEEPDEGKNEDRPIVHEYTDSLTMVGTSSKNTDEQDVATQNGVTEASDERMTMCEAHIDAKNGGSNEWILEKDGDISSKVLDSVEVVDESVDEEEDPDVGKNKDRQIVREHEDSSRIVGKEFIKKVTCHYCKVCDLCLCYNPEIRRDEIVRAHNCHTPFLLGKNSDEQQVTTQECVIETSPSKSVIRGTTANKSRLDPSSKRRKRRKKKNESRKEKAKKRLLHAGLKLAIKVATDIIESIDKKKDPNGSENEDRPQEHEDSPKISGKKFIGKVSGYYCELCNLCLCYKQEMNEDEVLLAHCSTPLHLERSTTEGKDITTQQCVSPFKNVARGTMAKKPRLDSASKRKSGTKKTKAKSSSASSRNANEQKKFKNVTLMGTLAEEPPEDSLPASSGANEQNSVERQTYMSHMELYATLLLLNHRQSLDNALFALKKYGNFESKEILYGFGVCMLHAMINHSCDPNVDFITRGQEMVLYALKPITKGDQIFITYINSFAFISLQERQQKIMSYPSSKFQFNCKCVACRENWKMYEELLKFRPKFLPPNKKAAIKAIQKIKSAFITKTADSTSRREIIQVIRQLRKCLHDNIERPSAACILCEQLLISAMKQFYDTSSPIELTELHKKEKLLGLLSATVSLIDGSAVPS